MPKHKITSNIPSIKECNAELWKLCCRYERWNRRDGWSEESEVRKYIFF